jgi:RNA polymerase sigma-70 factor (ECF subfamily)
MPQPVQPKAAESAAAADGDGASAAVDAQHAVDQAAAVLAVRQGDRAAMARLHQRYASMVHGIALARVPPDDAADLVQDVFVHAMSRLHLLRDPGAFGPWLAVIARNLASEFHRRRRLRLHRELPEDMIDPARTQFSHETEHAHHLMSVIRSLPESYAETLALRLVEGLSGPQIAACTGMTHGSVRVNLNRGMALLRERLRELNIKLEDSP